jgi:hypothetical protein
MAVVGSSLVLVRVGAPMHPCRDLDKICGNFPVGGFPSLDSEWTLGALRSRVRRLLFG